MSDQDFEEWGGFSEDDLSDDEDAIPIYPEGGALCNDGSTVKADTIQQLQDAINAHGKANGYAVNRQNASNRIAGQPTYYTIVCDRFGLPRPTEGVRLRKSSTRKSGCKFKASAKLTDEGWVFRHHKDPRYHVHNHPKSLDPSAHPQHRKIKSPVKNLVKKMSSYSAIKAREISKMVEEEEPNSHFTIKDINNARQAFRRQEKDGCSASGAVIKAFDQEGVLYVPKWDTRDPNRLLGIAFTFPECQEMWKRFPDCLSFDNTHSTNALGFPLFVITTQTNINSTANVAFGLINNERREGFDFLAQGVKELQVQLEARSPAVTITDKDERMRDALKETFPDAQQQLCRFHINKNFTTEEPSEDRPGSRTKITHDAEGVLTIWKILVRAKTKEEFVRIWTWLIAEFSDQEEILQYLQAEWLPLREQWAEYCTRRHLNFSQSVTSQTESSNFNIKSYLVTGKSDFLRLTKALKEMCQNQHRNYNQEVAKQMTRIKMDYLHQDYLGDLPQAVSLKALEHITREKRHAQKALNMPAIQDPKKSQSAMIPLNGDVGVPKMSPYQSPENSASPAKSAFDLQPHREVTDSPNEVGEAVGAPATQERLEATHQLEDSIRVPEIESEPEPEIIVNTWRGKDPERRPENAPRISGPARSQGAVPNQTLRTTRSGRTVMPVARIQESQEQPARARKRPRRC
ncbi:hypothetical protein CHGG_09478 [Chaetomium globosum CBS 148.51]|uniref:MULE transposase domain-containing protein n=1 Tax=Chaetomium globosum (strain ATCC 6205 / CBS 148.51 / DSM 1962 / NBRC 6347 / NRRL 1970) TaxID=306901 RepID=Q2GRC6_CHAGB|nr:uncharacterized protein CHGG_09478 [Chaetomium globosum CBS 148.51]EAQ85464.1 hypothetical protein CHGG_09478 [Chaetomium globosum CBS 148.51]